MNARSLCAAGSPTNVAPAVEGPFRNEAIWFQAVPFQTLSVPVQHADCLIGAPVTQP